MVKRKKRKNKWKKITIFTIHLHSKFDIYKLKTPLIIVARIALKDRVDLISIMVSLEVIAKNYKHYICKCFWIKHKYGTAET